MSVLVFCLQQLMPGDPALVLAGEERDPAVLAQIRAELWLDRPLPVQYLHWIGHVLQGDLGFSWRIREPVATLVLTKLPVTAAARRAWPSSSRWRSACRSGVLSAVYKNRALDYIANGIGLAGLSTPNFWLGIMLILLVSVQPRLAAAVGLRAARPRTGGSRSPPPSCRPSCSATPSPPS